MSTKLKVTLSVLALVTSYAFGYYEAPTKVKEVVHTVEVEKKVDDTKTDAAKDTHKSTTVTVVQTPDGTKTTTTKVDEDTKSDTKTDDKSQVSDTKTVDETKEVTKSGASTYISVLSRVDVLSSQVSGSPVVFGASVSKDILGPVQIGVFGYTDRTFGASVGLRF